MQNISSYSEIHSRLKLIIIFDGISSYTSDSKNLLKYYFICCNKG